MHSVRQDLSRRSHGGTNLEALCISSCKTAERAAIMGLRASSHHALESMATAHMHPHKLQDMALLTFAGSSDDGEYRECCGVSPPVVAQVDTTVEKLA